MLVYLDHAQIVELDRLKQQDTAGFADFLEFWLAHGCRLVISRAHLHEIGQSDDEDSVRRRLDMLRYFPAVASASDENEDWVAIREIRQQTLHRLRSDGPPTAATYAPVRAELYHPVDFAALEAQVVSWRSAWQEEFRTRNAQAALDNVSRALMKLYRKATQRKQLKWDPGSGAAIARAMRQGAALGGDPLAVRWNREVADRIEACYARGRNLRNALVCAYDLAGMPAAGRAPVADLARIGFLGALGRHWVERPCRLEGHATADVDAALEAFDPYDAPAISISLAVERGRKSQDKSFEASDYMDASHVRWAAYADIAFVDRRTRSFLAQAHANKQMAGLLSPHRLARIESAATPDDVRERIGRIARE